MLTPHCFVADKQVEFTIIALFQPCLEKSEIWLQSLLKQGHRCDTEVILILPQDTEKIDYKVQWKQLLEKYQAEIWRSPYSFTYLVESELNNPIHYNSVLNKAVHLANGEWIYLSPSSNQLVKSAFFEFTAVIKEFPDVELISGCFKRLKNHQQILEKSQILEAEDFVPDTFKSHFLYQNPLSFGSTVFRKYLWQRSGGFKTDLEAAALWELLRRLAHGCFRWYYVPRCITNIDATEETGQLFNHKGNLSAVFLQVVTSKHACYSPQEMMQSQEAIARQLFQYINDCFQEGRFTKGYAVIFELLQCDRFGDRFWLEYLRKMDQKQIPYKQAIFNTVQIVKQRCLV